MAGKSRTVRMIGGVRHFLYGGYATWIGRGERYHVREVRAWLPATLGDADDCGPNTDAMFAGLREKARKRYPKAEVREAWRY